MPGRSGTAQPSPVLGAFWSSVLGLLAAPALGCSGAEELSRLSLSRAQMLWHSGAQSLRRLKPFNAQPSWRTSVRSTWCSVILALGTSLRLEFSDAQLLRRSALPIFAI